ncbi:hypothetical protein M2105_006548, partial [Paenibacillus sp. PastF-1]|nr:hypothetical protein [Paenibacillus sp. PastF-2]MDF9852045.1 hypothetical protein [Paenibacillus sp. PastM-2]MDF9858620.1 hypothetical protein [Paenibacillus sp. PastF-1]MDH6483886.1 hypothetical protein [Paenibacillus sp. PastH-2]MDH6511247.1 hypothetical protein [Paenibacillus sp. PastM-3]
GALLTFWNRRMRTRMYGGVRGRGLAAPSYSIGHMRKLLRAKGKNPTKSAHPSADEPH